MPALVVPLSDIIIDPINPIDLTTLTVAEASELIRKSYGFLATEIDLRIENGIATISLEEASIKKVDEATDWFNRGIRKANQTDYKGAIQLFQRTVEYLPLHSAARRNLAMAYLELGNQEEALNYLIDVLRIDPKDVWAYILVGNIYGKYRKDFASAEIFYKKAYEINPNDPYLLNNYAAIKVDKGELEEAERMFRTSIEANPKYPNSTFGLALLYHNQNKYAESLVVMEKFFKLHQTEDPRSKPVFDDIRSLYLQVHHKKAEDDYESLMAFVHSRGNAIESITGYPVEFTEDDALQGLTAKSILAWKHHTSKHQVLYLPHSKEILPHILIHELEHILLEHEARQEKKNKRFVGTEKNREYARQLISDDIQKLRKVGYDENEVNEILSQWIDGLVNQLYNNPLDMIIEKRIFDKYEILRSSQFVALHKTQQDNLLVLTNSEIQKITPRIIYHANQAMNCAYTIFNDWLNNGITNYCAAYKSSSAYAAGETLFNTFLESAKSFHTGDEYQLISEFAAILKLENWFEIENDLSQYESVTEGATNPELLKAKESAAVMYCLDALNRFEKMPTEKIQEIAFEIGLLGTLGIDYTKADRRYSLKALPGEQFNGLQLLTFMYVGFKKIDPTVNTGLDFEDAYQTALKLFEA
jgi:tetratricopeptide (TPR) repeat protein